MNIEPPRFNIRVLPEGNARTSAALGANVANVARARFPRYQRFQWMVPGDAARFARLKSVPSV